MRKAILKKWVASTGVGKPGYWTDDGPVLFHEFGCDFLEINEGIATFSTALIEHPDGQMENVPVYQIRFVDERSSRHPLAGEEVEP